MARLFIGLMSGTSLDGVDAVVADLSTPNAPQCLGHAHRPYPDELKQALLDLHPSGPDELHRSQQVGLELARVYAQVTLEVMRPFGLAPQDITALGAHGQTVRHCPTLKGGVGYSVQLNQPALLAELTGIDVVADLRSRDIAAGGQGAPLVPAFHHALWGDPNHATAALNLGGIANLTLLPPASGPDRGSPVLGWDCGPANTLLDLAVQRFSGGEQSFDADGAWASRGAIDEALIQRWLGEPYFQQTPPKSTGRELFGAADLERRLAELDTSAADRGSPLEPADALASLTAFSAAVVAQDLAHGPAVLELLVAGGGARNTVLMEQLRRRCHGLMLRPLAELGIGDSDREALAFALLAWRLLRIAARAASDAESLVVIGVGAMLMFQVVVNISMTIGLGPVTGIPLPWVSYGRSAMLVNFVALGLCAAVNRRSRSSQRWW